MIEGQQWVFGPRLGSLGPSNVTFYLDLYPNRGHFGYRSNTLHFNLIKELLFTKYTFSAVSIDLLKILKDMKFMGQSKHNWWVFSS